MAYQVLARKWRPQQFDDVVGQRHVTETLKNAITSGRLAHAYLFVGPRGTGKTTMARIMAKALNCAGGTTTTPCETCDNCREISAGNNLDVMEIDGASNNGVEQVRELRDTVKFAPVNSPFKIFIIDEVHMLSNAAFNALLKTLEEPPAHVKFIFATTEPQKILPTILSRCQRFDLRRIPVAQIVERLALIAKTEQIAVDDDAMLAIARGAEGGLRDAESALDQLMSFKSDRIVEADVLSIFGMVARKTLESLAEAILRGDIPRIIAIVAELDGSGKDMQRVTIELLDHFRHLLVCLALDGKAPEGDLTEGQLETLRAQASLTQIDRLLRMADILVEVDGQLRYALSRRTLLETALIRCARASSVASLEEILRRVTALQQGTGQGAGSSAPAITAPAAVASAAPAAAPVAQVAAAAAASRAAAPDADPKKKVDSDADLALLEKTWHEIIDRVGRMAVLGRSCLMDARPLSVAEAHVVIGFDPEFPDNVANARGGRVPQAVQRVLSQVLGRPISVEYTLMDKTATVQLPTDHRSEDPGNVAAGSPPVEAQLAPPPAEAPAARRPPSQGTRDWKSDPAVLEALKVFEGRIVDVRE